MEKNNVNKCCRGYFLCNFAMKTCSKIKWKKVIVFLILTILSSYYICNYFLYFDLSHKFQKTILNSPDPTIIIPLDKINILSEYESFIPYSFTNSFLNKFENCFKNLNNFNTAGYTATSSTDFSGLGGMSFNVILNDTIVENLYIAYGQTKCVSVPLQQTETFSLSNLIIKGPMIIQNNTATPIKANTNNTESYLWPGKLNEFIIAVVMFLFFSTFWSTLLGIRDIFWKQI